MYDVHTQLFAEHSTSIEDIDRFIEALKQRVVNFNLLHACTYIAWLKKCVGGWVGGWVGVGMSACTCTCVCMYMDVLYQVCVLRVEGFHYGNVHTTFENVRTKLIMYGHNDIMSVHF